MNGDEATRAQPVLPLRPKDPVQLGRYRIVGRLGEGGMGSVYLAERPDGGPVAVKVVRADLADDVTFRNRFRSEVARARQVPPFCTAEVLDADPDHDPPYLVVEYVDGPSLADVVQARGPLTPANLHGLAIGVAAALTAIHGAGVIHRDLKPSNVLLALGSPKVIDFGIAQGVDGATGHTTHGQMVGTVAYMAPERFGTDGTQVLTAAADVFAWGAVVAYAGTGRIPFFADSGPVMAVRILTQEPDLDGLEPTLRELVGQALAKDPTQRPTARALLDRLLASGSRRGLDLTETLAGEPQLLAAAAGAPLAVGTPANTTRIAAFGPVDAEPASPAVPAVRPATSWWSRITTIALVLLLLVVAAGVVGVYLSRQQHTAASGPTSPTNSAPGSDPAHSAGPSTSPSVALPPGVPPGAHQVLADQLAAAGNWQPINDGGNKASCVLQGSGLLVTKQDPFTYRCPGPSDLRTTFEGRTEFAILVDVTILRPDSCAGIWFRFTDAAGGYVVKVCQDRYEVVTHSPGGINRLRAFTFDGARVPTGTRTQVAISVRGDNITLYRNGKQLGVLADSTFPRGRVVLGISEADSQDRPPYVVSFANIEIWSTA